MAVDWKSIDLPRWYDCKLGRLSDSELARLVGTTMTTIRYRRMLFEIPVYTVAQVLEPYLDRLGVDSDRAIAAQCGVSPPSVKAYRMSLGIAPAPLPGKHIPTRPLMPKGHALRPYKSLLGFVADQELADFVGLPVEDVEQIRQAMGLHAAAAAPDILLAEQHANYPGPWLVDFLPALKSGDSFCKRLKSQAGDVPRSIDVTVMDRSAITARPLPYSKSGPTFRTAGRNNTTARARLG